MNRNMLILIFLIIPIGCSCILGYEMGFRRIENIPIVVLDHDRSDFTAKLTDYIADSSSFQLVGDVLTDEEMKEALTTGTAAIGIIFPEDFYQEVREGKAPDLLVLYDGTKLHLLAFAKVQLSEILLTAQAGYMQNVFAGKLSVVPEAIMDYTMPMNVTYQVLFNPARSMSNFLLPGLLAALLQVGMTIVGVEAAKEKTTSIKADLMRIGRYGLLGTASLLLCFFTQWAFFGMPYKGTIVGGILSAALFTFCMTAFGYLFGSLIEDRVLSTQIACVLVLPTSLIGGYTFPLLAMPEPFQWLGAITAFSWYGDVIRNLTMMEQSLHHLRVPMLAMTGIFLGEIALIALVRGVKQARERRHVHETTC